jgi:hypothetical protein
VPYRQSKLTLLMKDCFDISCSRLCNTVVLAHVSPLARDVAHSLNTIKYAAPLRVAIAAPNPHLQRDDRDPALWSQDRVAEWVASLPTSRPGGASVLDVAALLNADRSPAASAGLRLVRRHARE